MKFIRLYCENCRLNFERMVEVTFKSNEIECPRCASQNVGQKSSHQTNYAGCPLAFSAASPQICHTGLKSDKL